MEEIRIGDYCRTKNGYIAKITEIDNYIWFNEKINKESGMAVYELSKVEFENLVVKQSKHIIDLIEVGDYVNGEKVVGRGNNCILILTDEGQTFLRNIFEDNDIKSIVTKEAFKSVEYIVGESNEES